MHAVRSLSCRSSAGVSFASLFGGGRATFFIQQSPREVWHIESPEHCEYMLCGKFISVDTSARIRSGAAPSYSLGCPDCWMKWQRARREE